ncbi:amidohydrolase family protein [Nocardia brasiliensis]
MSGLIPNVIDVHAHAMLTSWHAALQERFGTDPPRIEGYPVPAWSPELAIEVMEDNGVQAMVPSNPTGTKDVTQSDGAGFARRMNEELAEIVRRYPTRFGAFAVLPLQHIDAALTELTYALDTFAELNRRRSTAFVHPIGPTAAEGIDLPIQKSPEPRGNNHWLSEHPL